LIARDFIDQGMVKNDEKINALAGASLDPQRPTGSTFEDIVPVVKQSP
jgi:hypothetical protein